MPSFVGVPRTYPLIRARCKPLRDRHTRPSTPSYGLRPSAEQVRSLQILALGPAEGVGET